MSTVAQHYSAGSIDPEVRDKLLREQLTEVRFIARRIHDRLPQHVALDDLVHAGVLGLMDAINKYSPDRNVQFNTYARYRIKGAIIDSLRAMDWSPRNLRQKARVIEEAEKGLRHSLGRPPTEVEIAAALKVSLEDLQGQLMELRGLEVTSLDSESFEGDAQRFDANSQMQDQRPDAFASMFESERRQILAQAIEELPARDQQVLSLYYFEELTMKEVGQVLGVTESRVCQIHSAALVRMRSRVGELLGQTGDRTEPSDRHRASESNKSPKAEDP